MLPLLPIFVCGLSGLVVAGPLQYYATKYDHIDVETILNNRRMVNYYAACLLSKGPCPPEGVEFKRILPEALRTNCLRCTEKQKTVTLRTIKRLKKEYPKIWIQLQDEWDPNGTYVTKFENTFINSYKEPTSSIPVIIKDRFGDDNEEKIIENTVGFISSSTTSTTTIKTTKPTTYTTTTKAISKTSTIKKSPSTTQKTTKKPITASESTQIISNKPIVTSTISNTYIAPIAVPYRPLTNIGAGIQATVSLGTNIVGEFVRGLGALGNRVVETGAEIAEVVLKNIARPL